MFWSHDLLGKKTALGAVWIAAHGKKLNKGRILQVNVTEACKKVMDPEVPQALRLQAILVGGIVVVHARQQVYLLEDAQETLRRLRSLEGGEAGGRGGRRTTLGEGRTAAREEAITLPLNADLHFLNLGDLFPAFHTQALSEGGGGGGQVGDGLFVIPTLPDDLSEGSAPAAKPRSGRHRRGGGTAAGEGGTGALLAGAGQEAELEVALHGLPRHDLELMDGPETFVVPDMELVVPGMEEFFGLGGPAGSMGAAPGQGGQGGDFLAVPEDLLPVTSGLEAALGGEQQKRGATSHARSASTEPSEASGPPAGARDRRRGGGGGRRRVRPLLDDLDTLQIRGRDYRDWMNDSSDLLLPRPRQPGPPAAAGGPAKSALAVGPATAAATPGAAWPAELAQLFERHATLPKAEGQHHAKKGKGAAAGQAGAAAWVEDALEEQERYLDELAAGNGTADAAAPLEDAGFAFGFGGYQGLEGFGGLEGSGIDSLGANPFQLAGRAAGGGRDSRGSEDVDVETERLRAALNSTQGSDPFYLEQLGMTPASAEQGRSGSAAATGRGGRGAKRGSGVLRRDSESGAATERSSERRGSRRLSDLLEGGGPGVDDLGAMLPAVGEEDEYVEGGGSAKRARTEEAAALGTGTNLSDFHLLEASGPTQAAGGGAAAPPPTDSSLNRQTLAFLGVMRGRFDAAQGAAQPADSREGGSDGDASMLQLSLFELAARLSRMDAAKLFYQTMQARTHGFLLTQQEEPYGDILLQRGARL